MNDNPWCHLPTSPPYVLPHDEPQVRDVDARAGPDYRLHIAELLPEAFVGNREAPVVLLSNNPGYTEEGVPPQQEAAIVARMRNNLLHGPSDYPFLFLAPDVGGRGKRWWARKLKALRGRFGDQVVARSILNVPYFPYPSRKFGHRDLRLPSQDYSFRLVREAMERGAVIVFMRKGRAWLDAVPELGRYHSRYEVKNFQNPAISCENCAGFEKVVQAIEAAEKTR